MLITVAFFAVLGLCLSVAIVGWGARRLGLPIQETIAWFGLTEPPGLRDDRGRPVRPSRRRPVGDGLHVGPQRLSG